MKTRTISILFVILLLYVGVTNVYSAVKNNNKITISGVVKDQSDEPIIGASVVLKVGASSSGSVTDVFGRFNLSIDTQEQTLFQITVSYIGCKSAGGVYSVSSLKNGKGTVTVKLIDDVKKNKTKSSTIVAHDFSSSSNTDSFTFDFKYPSASTSKTPVQIYNEANNYYNGTNGVSKDYKKAIELYLQAAERGHVDAQFRLGYYYAMESVPVDYKQAMQWYLKAAERGNRSAMCNIGIMYERGQGVSVDKSQALAWYNKAAEAGLEIAKENAEKLVAQGVKPATLTTTKTTTPQQETSSSNLQKALDYYLGLNGVKRDNHIAFHYMKLAAEEDHEQVAYCMLGQMYENGYGVDNDYKAALQNYEKGTEGSDPSWSNWATTQIAMMYYHGHGMEKNVAKAKQMLLPLAQKGDMAAEQDLGYIHLGEKEYQQAIQWYVKSAEQGNSSSYNDLGYMYLEGEGVNKDYDKALNYFTKAIELGSISSKSHLGRMYENGWGVKKDIPKALALIREAADLDSPGGQYHLGRLYENGIGVKKDMVEAISWYRKSAAQDYEKAQKRLQELEEMMAQGSPVKVKKQQSIPMINQKRIALIIGNGDYTDGPLANPVNDAKDMGAKLSELGFEVMGKTNMESKGEIRNLVREFCAKAKNYDAVLLYYSGHARQDNGINYLIPTRTDIMSEGDIEDQCMSMNWIVKEMQRTGSKNVIVLLDACRNAPPIPQLTREESAKGLANMPAKRGTFVGFATQSGDVALDGRGQRNSPYTAALLKMLSEPGLPHYTLFRRVKQMVLDATDQKQMPAEDDKLPEDFIFNMK